MKRKATSDRPRILGDRSAFTLIEIMIVVAIMAVIVAMGLPSILASMHPDPLRKAAADLRDVCNSARERAILTGSTTQITFHPLEKRFEVDGVTPESGSGRAPEGTSGQLPDDVKIQVLDVNLKEYKEKEEATVRFFPNGTSDEMTVVFINDKNVQRAVSLEITTALADIETGDMNKLISK
jgi:prepilin-type N-terminal cleavage/methylation domain-containing protein